MMRLALLIIFCLCSCSSFPTRENDKRLQFLAHDSGLFTEPTPLPAALTGP